ncbi:VOC family protein [Aliiglaciecola sp. 2_MG-2023]|uniref:VOC family protein n=1 Tax=unclassified Aliiglaciecola TaxID=2593648 RepID=UPI0026E1ED1E|nr:MULTISPECIES: VOC family protein [unclassified Aliiglaciecola]MDO6709682.1 VOC family protein [Aliiglaciecola sp. 2_MG-2023]MDO6750776.1 VOC family protein [Aliiglaciecola sp. 1_MG-2023]
MELGQFSVSLAVKDIVKSKAFYEMLGFKTHEGCGSVEDKWLILQKDTTVIGLFEGMFEDNILTFNPLDVRSIEAHIRKNGYPIDSETQGESGPAHCILKDPDGNVIMFDQHQ